MAELVENASKVTEVGEPVHLGVRAIGTDLLIEVTDSSELTPVRRCASELDEGGRGLLLVQELTSLWGWHPVEGGKVVWAVL
ncbi:ATP-binding protein [Kitasatospora acidiphila]|uniref:ATP-binding protein n=1 Tax=Kitasatospora acidiphila TaxID=2567942 RepID=A0A540WBD8_9ACTN|nr:ATP-binding protein [Kitasatospora acidiphila]